MRTLCRAIPTTNHRRCSTDVPDMEAIAVIFHLYELTLTSSYKQTSKKQFGEYNLLPSMVTLRCMSCPGFSIKNSYLPSDSHINTVVSDRFAYSDVGGAVASWLVRSSPDRAVRVGALAGDIVLCSWARHLTLTVPLSTQVYEWVPANLMLGVTLRWTGILSRGE